jgi:hypothetical protein
LEQFAGLRSLRSIIRQSFEKILPNTVLRPTRKAPVRIFLVTKALRQIPPRRTRPELPNHNFDEQAIAAFTVAANMAGATRQKILYLGKLIVSQTIACHYQSLLQRSSL